jgi:hypothetical protein
VNVARKKKKSPRLAASVVKEGHISGGRKRETESEILVTMCISGLLERL